MCFGGGKSKPQVVSTGTQQITDKSWETLEPYIKNVLESSRSRFEDQLAEGYQPMPGGYEGRYEGPSPEELAAREGMLQQGLSGIAGTGMASARPYYESGLSALSSSMGEFGPQQAQQYMNPYQQAVVDVAKREAVRSAQPTFRGIGDRAEATGAFGGSRQAIAEAEANRNLQQQLGDIQTTGMQQAYGQGRAAFEAQKAREAAGAARLFGQAPAAWQQGIREMGAVEEVGRARRGDEQAKKDFLYEQFEAEKTFPSQVYGEHLGHVRGFPYQPSMYKTTTDSRPRPGLGRQLLGAGMGLASMGKNLGLWGGASGGQVQGGLSGLVQRHQNNVHPDVDVGEELVEDSSVSQRLSEILPQKSSSDILKEYLTKRLQGKSSYDKYLTAKDKAQEARRKYYTEGREKEEAYIKDLPTQTAWDQLGKVGAAMMGAPGHMDILQSLGQGIQSTGAIDAIAKAKQDQLAGLKSLRKEGLELAEAEAGDELERAKLRMASDETKLNAAKVMVDLEKAGVLDASDYANVAAAIEKIGHKMTPEHIKQKAFSEFGKIYKETKNVGTAMQAAMKILTGKKGPPEKDSNKDRPTADQVLADEDSPVSNIIKDYGGPD